MRELYVTWYFIMTCIECFFSTNTESFLPKLLLSESFLQQCVFCLKIPCFILHLDILSTVDVNTHIFYRDLASNALTSLPDMIFANSTRINIVFV
jgi:hypothetical protein